MNHFTQKRAIKDFKFGVDLHSFAPHFLFRIPLFCILLYYSLKLVINGASDFFTIFMTRESTKNKGLNFWVSVW